MHKYLPSFLALAMSAFLALAAGAVQALSYYGVDRTVGAASITGYLVTDGTIGELTWGKVVGYELTFTSPNMSGGTPETIRKPTGGFIERGDNALTASATDLTFYVNPDDCSALSGSCLGLELFNFSAIGSLGNFIAWRGSGTGFNFPGCAVNSECIYSSEFDDYVESTPNLRTFSLPRIADVPLPAAMPLLVAGLGFIGFVGRRRRKTAA